MKFLAISLLVFCSFPLMSAEKITFERYKELIQENYPNLYNYLPGRVFLTTENIDRNYSDEESGKVYVCKYNFHTKNTIIHPSALMTNDSYYELHENWIEPFWDINTEEGKVCEKKYGNQKEVNKAVYLTRMILPPLIRPNIIPFWGPDLDLPELHTFSLDEEKFVIEEWSFYDTNYKYVYDFSKPTPFSQKFAYQNDKLIFETKELQGVNVDELVLTLDKVPVYMGFLRPNGLTRTLKISDDFKKFWQEDIDKGPFALPVTTVEGL